MGGSPVFSRRPHPLLYTIKTQCTQYWPVYQVIRSISRTAMLQNLKCRTTDQSKRQGEFIDIAEQCKNQTDGRTSSLLPESDYPSVADYNNRDDRSNGMDSGGRTGNQDGRRNNNREYNVHRQDFDNTYGGGSGNSGDRGNDGRGNGGRGNDGRGNDGRGNGGDRGIESCNLQSQQFSVSAVKFIQKIEIICGVFFFTFKLDIGIQRWSARKLSAREFIQSECGLRRETNEFQ